MILSLNGLPAHEINDSNFRDYVPDNEYRVRDNQGNEHFTGCLPVEDWDVASMRTLPFEASGIVLYDEREIKERLEEMWRGKASLMHLGYQFDSLKQNAGTCWVHCASGASSLLIAAAGLPYRVPSPMSIAYHCYSGWGTGGGYPSLAVEKFQQHGAVRTELWGENERVKALNDRTKDDRKYHWLEEIAETGSGEQGFLRVMSAACQGYPSVVSYSWWRHAVYCCWGRVDNGEIKLGIRNSWGNSGYGDKGFGLLSGSRKYPSWSCVFLRMRQSPGAA